MRLCSRHWRVRHAQSVAGLVASAEPPTIGRTVRLEAALAFGYSLIVNQFADRADSFTARAIRWWIDTTAAGVDLLMFLIPGQQAGSGSHISEEPADEIAVYRHVLAFCFLIATVAFLATKRHWAAWAQHQSAALDRAFGNTDPKWSVAEFGARITTLGAAASILLLLFGDVWIYGSPLPFPQPTWLLLRAPLLVTLAYACACRAVAFRLYRPLV